VDIVVCVKTNPDLQMVRIKGREPVLEAVPFKVGDLEKNALEAALQLRDAAGAGTITAVTVSEGDRKIRETMKEALAIGADEAVIVADDGLGGADQAGVALALAKAVEKAGAFDLLLFGEGSSDGYSGQVPGRVAELLGLAEIGYARKVEASGAGVRAERSMGDVVEVLEAPTPVAVTVVSEINEPRIPSLMHIMKAGKKPVTELTLADLGLGAGDVAPRRGVVSNLAEEQARKHVMFEGDVAQQAEALVSALVAEGVLGR
jgi:electron transfer flavoprotein beta subunit